MPTDSESEDEIGCHLVTSPRTDDFRVGKDTNEAVGRNNFFQKSFML